MERNLIGERTSMAMQRKRVLREYTGGAVPYGWTLAEDGTHLEADDREQAIIGAARDLREEGLSLERVGKRLEGEGLLPRSGGKWHAKTVRDLLRAEAA